MSDVVSDVADIAVNVGVNKTFHYRIPDEMRGRLVCGSRVLVSFGNRRIPGTVLGFPGKAEATGLKSVLEILEQPLPPDLMELARWMADYYLHPLGRTIEAVLPKALSRAKARKKKYVRLKAGPSGMRGEGVRGKKQAALIRLLSEQGETATDQLAGFSAAVIKALVDSGIAEIVERETNAQTEPLDFTPSDPPQLMPAQREAVEAVSTATGAGKFRVFLLHGVT